MYDKLYKWIVDHAFEFNLWLAMLMAFVIQVYVQRRKNEQARAFDRILSGFICSLLTVAVILPSNFDYSLFMFVGIVVGATGIEAFLQMATKIADSFINSKVLSTTTQSNDKPFNTYKKPQSESKKLSKGYGRKEPPMPKDLR